MNTTSSPSPSPIKTISKDSVQRLMRDVRQVLKEPLTDNGIYYQHDDEDMLKGYAMIVGPKETPYEGGFYFFELNYPTDYPTAPPTVIYCTNGDGIRFNPNLYKCGKVCISLLNTWRGEQWTSCQTISTVLLTLCTLLNNEPLLNEPGVTQGHTDFNNYNQIIEYKNWEIAVLQNLEKKGGVFLPAFEVFHSTCLDIFKKEAESILKRIEEKGAVDPVIIKTNFYKMSVCVDYQSLLKKWKKEMMKHGIIEEKEPDLIIKKGTNKKEQIKRNK